MKSALIILLITSLVAATLCSDFKNCGSLKSGDFIANKANRNFFFVCVNGYLMELRCSKYVNFDPIYDICTEAVLD